MFAILPGPSELRIAEFGNPSVYVHGWVKVLYKLPVIVDIGWLQVTSCFFK